MTEPVVCFRWVTAAITANDLHAVSGGRYVLGLGTQIKPHVTRRFSMPLSRPADRMREYVQAVRAIWATWNEGEPLRFSGDSPFSILTGTWPLTIKPSAGLTSNSASTRSQNHSS